MISARIVLILTFRDGVLFRTKRFRPDYRYTQSFLSTLEADEVCIVDVGEDREAFYRSARAYADRCFSPVTIGGRIRSLEEVGYLFREVGADKVLMKWDHPLGSQVVEKYGKQALVSGVDYSGNEDPLPLATAAPGGEILLTSVDRDGSLQGYDIPNLERVCRAVTVPVVASGGCGSWEHMKQAFEAGASAAATSVIHHFTDPSLLAAKNYLSERGVHVRS